MLLQWIVDAMRLAPRLTGGSAAVPDAAFTCTQSRHEPARAERKAPKDRATLDWQCPPRAGADGVPWTGFLQSFRDNAGRSAQGAKSHFRARLSSPSCRVRQLRAPAGRPKAGFSEDTCSVRHLLWP